MIYLLKATLIWTVFLMLFEAFYKNSGRFTINRSYLAIAVLAGILLPLIHLPEAYTAGNRLAGNINAGLSAGKVNNLQPSIENRAGHFAWAPIITWVYSIGAVVLLLVSLREIGLILRHAVYSRYETINGQKVFASRRKIAPYSFMGWTFISTQTPFTAPELDYVLAHEGAHNQRLHWLDLLFLQLVCILFWFHPLVWRFRYLLRLQHEYEADQVAAATDAYTYGHFLLQQILLKGTPFIAHSFHYSPIKNRINMLTKTHSARFVTWKYALAVPALLACTLLMAAPATKDERLKTGNKTSFRGNDFYWQDAKPDTVIVQDPVTYKYEKTISSPNPFIIRLNDEPVVINSAATLQAQFRDNNQDFNAYLMAQFKKLSPNTPDSIAQIQVNDVIINKQGKMVYYDLLFMNAKQEGDMSVYSYHPELTPIMDKIIAESPAWLPASVDGNVVNAFVGFGINIQLKPVSFTFQADGPAKKVINSKAHVYKMKGNGRKVTVPDPKEK